MKKQALNPYLPSWEYIPDGEPHVYGDRVYVYGSHDQFNGWVFCQGDYLCWSAPVDDLSDWRCEGVIYEKTQDPLNADGHMCLYAPDVTRGPDGRWYLYYVLDKVSVVSVAVCDSPAGRYKFLGYVHYKDGTRLGERAGDEPQFDPAVLTEGDCTYMYTGFCGHGDRSRHGAMCTVLESDMLTIAEDPVFIVPGACYEAGTGYEGHAFFEASSIRKKGDTYYFVYSSTPMHELCYAVSDKPNGGFRYGGVIVSNADLHIGTYKPADMPACCGGNNHGGMVVYLLPPPDQRPLVQPSGLRRTHHHSARWLHPAGGDHLLRPQRRPFGGGGRLPGLHRLPPVYPRASADRGPPRHALHHAGWQGRRQNRRPHRGHHRRHDHRL